MRRIQHAENANYSIEERDNVNNNNNNNNNDDDDHHINGDDRINSKRFNTNDGIIRTTEEEDQYQDQDQYNYSNTNMRKSRTGTRQSGTTIDSSIQGGDNDNLLSTIPLNGKTLHFQYTNTTMSNNNHHHNQNENPPRSPLNQMSIGNNNNNNNNNENDNNKSSTFACIVTLTNTLLGVGIIGTPHAFAASGYLLGSFLFIMFAILSGIGLHLLAASAEKVGKYPSSFNTIASSVLSPEWTYLIDAAVAIKCFGVATSYLIVVGDNLPEIIHEIISYNNNNNDDDDDESWITKRSFAVTLAFLFVTPLAFAKTLGALKYTASAAIGFVIFIVCLIMYYAITGIDVCPVDLYPCSSKGESHAMESPSSIFSVLTIIIFGFTCHQNIFSICNEVQDYSMEKVNKIIIISLSIACSMYLLISWSGYMIYANQVDPDILDQFPDSFFILLARFFVCVLVICCYPLQCHPSRSCIFSIWDNMKKDVIMKSNYNRRSSYMNINSNSIRNTENIIEDIDDDDEDLSKEIFSRDDYIQGLYNNEEDNNNNNNNSGQYHHHNDQLKCYDYVLNYIGALFLKHRYEGVTLWFLILSYIIAISVNDLGMVLAIVGATGSTTITFILPGIIYWKLHPVKSNSTTFTNSDIGETENNNNNHNSMKTKMALIQLCLGCIIMPTCLTIILIVGGHE